MHRVAYINEGNEIRKFLKLLEDLLEIQGESFLCISVDPYPFTFRFILLVYS